MLVLIVAGCHKHTDVKAPTVTAPPPQPTAAKAEAPKPASPNLAVSDDLAKLCSLDTGSAQTAPKFDFDNSGLLPQDRDVLQQVADCLTKGPLKGKHLKLVGRADPRGTEEYNLGLGTQRAHSVREYLERLGVGHAQLAESTRGALDANGRDDDGWRTDRRVDLDVQ